MALFKKFAAWLTSPSNRPVGLYLGFGLIGGVALFVVFHFFFMKATNSTELCISCHEMDEVYAEYKKSSHYKNPAGVRVQCADCHIPHGSDLGDYVDKILDKAIVGTRHLYHHVIGTYPDQAAFKMARYRLAQNVLEHMRERDSKECRQCHTFEAMALSEQGKSAARKHERIMKEGDKTCVDCHSGITHEEQEEPEGQAGE